MRCAPRKPASRTRVERSILEQSPNFCSGTVARESACAVPRLHPVDPQLHNHSSAREAGTPSSARSRPSKPSGQRGFSRENSSRMEARNFAFGRRRSGIRSASSLADRRKRGDCVAWPLLPCFRLPIPPRPCCIDIGGCAERSRGVGRSVAAFLVLILASGTERANPLPSLRHSRTARTAGRPSGEGTGGLCQGRSGLVNYHGAL